MQPLKRRVRDYRQDVPTGQSAYMFQGDLILEVPNVIEAVTNLVAVTNRPGILNVLSAGT